MSRLGSPDHLAILKGEVAVSHTRNVVANAAVQAVAFDTVAGFAAEVFGVLKKIFEKLGDHPCGRLVSPTNFGAVVEVLEQMAAQAREFLPRLFAEGSESPGVVADVIKVLDFCLADILSCLADQIIDEMINQTPDHVPPEAGAVEGRAFPPGQISGAIPERHLFQGAPREEIGVQAIVEVMARIGDFIGEIRDLCLKRRGGVSLDGGWKNIAVGVFSDPFAHIPGEVEAKKPRVFFFEGFDDAEALGIVVEPALVLQKTVQLLLAAVATRRVAEVVRQCDGLRQILIQAQSPGYCAADGGHLDRVRESSSVVVAGAVKKNLGLSVESAEGGAVNDPSAVALNFRAVAVSGLRVKAA